MQILESQLREHIRLLLKEEIYGTIATVYHGSLQAPDEFLRVFETGDLASYASTGWKPGKGAGSMYGHGLYSVWMKTDHKTFKGDYGSWIYKLKVNLHGFIIFDDAVCKKVYGKSITPLEQMKLLGKADDIKKATEEELEALSNPPVKNERSADISRNASSFLKGRVNGIVFFGRNDGPVVLIYDPDIVTPLAWTKLDKFTRTLDPWKSWNASEIKQSLKRASNAGAQIDAERLQLKRYDVNKIVNNESAFKKRYQSFDKYDKVEFARNSQSNEILTKLCEDKDEDVREYVALNPNTPAEALVILANQKDEYSGIRRIVARNPNTPAEALSVLAKDKYAGIHLDVALNRNTPAETLAQLAEDPWIDVRGFVASNPSTPAEALSALAKERSIDIRVKVAGNPNTSVETLTYLAGIPGGSVHLRIARNPNAPIEILKQFSISKDYETSEAALKALQKLGK
jgi:hypothetical protein